jgi:hypothetical protein
MNHIKLKQIILWFVLVILFAIWGIAFQVYHQADSLKQHQHESNERVYEKIKDTELKNYVELAEQAIAHLYHSGKSDADTQKEAKDILRNLSYGPGLDGYFFLFDLKGVMLMHPRQPELVGQDLWTLTDENGDPSIQRLIQQAKREGTGFVNYNWPRPSNENTVSVPKRAYVSVLKNWGWVLGTGVYLDDVYAELKKFSKPTSINIIYPMMWIIGFSSVGLLVIGGLIWSTKRRSEVNTQPNTLTQKDGGSRISPVFHNPIAAQDGFDKSILEVEHEEDSTTATRGVPRTQVFISYSHEDRLWLEWLQTYLRPLEEEYGGKIDCWADTRVETGERWRQDIEEALARTKVAVLLVSPHFLASKFITKIELPSLLKAAEQDGATIMPVIVSPCRFLCTPSLAQFKAANDPKRTLLHMKPAGWGQVFLDLSVSIEKAFSIADAPAGAAKG